MDRKEHLLAAVDFADRLLNSDTLSGSEAAAIMREKRISLAEIDELSGVEEGSTVDELTRRRETRRSAAGMA